MAAPVKVSPLIKLCRYVSLGFGVSYGVGSRFRNQMTEDAIRAQREKDRPAREAREKAEKKVLYDAEMAYLAKETGAVAK